MEIAATNAAHALSAGLELVREYGRERPSRNGPVSAMDEPTTITYSYPDQRVIFAPERDANPFFHLYECLWMMGGRRDVKSVADFVPGMRNYSDDGKIFNAAYGHRWRSEFGVDQIDAVVRRLLVEGGENDRRAYMTMWQPRKDTAETLDVPCNVGVAFRCRSDGSLDMTVFNRSNDLILGACGANVVHMSFLHELVARAADRPLGCYYQVTNDLHLYLEHEKTMACATLAGAWHASEDLYSRGDVCPYPVINSPWAAWNEDLQLFLQYGDVVALRDPFFRRVAGPVVLAHRHYTVNTGRKRYEEALEILEQCLASDWKRACQEWVQRRFDKWESK